MYADPLFLEAPTWPLYARRRLRASLLLATIVVATRLALLRLPLTSQAWPLTGLLVTILIDEVESMARNSDPEEDSRIAITDEVRFPVPVATGAQTAEPADPVDSPDWYSQIPDAARAALDGAPGKFSVNPAFDELRHEAAAKFAPGRAIPPQPVREHVEKDVMGRSLLWSGDCFRVIDDSNAGSRDAFETFGQYITFCMNRKDSPQELPWVSEIQSRRADRARSAHPAAE